MQRNGRRKRVSVCREGVECLTIPRGGHYVACISGHWLSHLYPHNFRSQHVKCLSEEGHLM